MNESRLHSPTAAASFPVVDLHAHPGLKAYLFRARFWKAHDPPAGVWPFTMNVDLDALLAGGVQLFVGATYVVERAMFRDIWPLRFLAASLPRGRRLASGPMDQLTTEALDGAEEMVRETRRRRGDVIEVARTLAEARRIAGSGRICMLHALEGAHHLNGKLEMVETLVRRGVCMMVVPHLYPNEAGGCVDLFSRVKWPLRLGCLSAKRQDESGLSPWGRQLVERLLDVGIIVDVTHGTAAFQREVIELARRHPKRRPVVMSHVYFAGSFQSGKAPGPPEIRAIADTGGVVGLMMARYPEPGHRHARGIEIVLEGIDHLVRHGGDDVVAIGSDFDGFTRVAKDMKSPRDYASFREAMLRKYTETQVAKFLAGNAWRVLEEGWGR
jgi:membrane dipeptidase